MYKKIKHYLLVHFPLLWNVQIIPTLSVIVLLNLALFFINYTQTSLSPNYEIHLGLHFADNIVAYIFIVLTSLLIAIMWFRFYMRNNAIKAFYPKSTGSLYNEWIWILLIIFGIASFYSSFNLGEITKESSYATPSEVSDALNTIEQVKLLLPNTLAHYEKFKDPNSTSVENNTPTYSLLNYITESKDSLLHEKLVSQDKEYIETCFTKYFSLEQKWNLHSNTSIATCMQLLYHPPLYLLDQKSIIKHSTHYANTLEPLYTNIDNIESFYETIRRAKESVVTISGIDAPLKYGALSIYTPPLSVAFAVSIFIIAFRLSSRNYLKTCIFILLVAYFHSALNIAVLICILFVSIFVYLYYLIQNKRTQGFSTFLILPLLLLTRIASFSILSLLTSHDIDSNDSWHHMGNIYTIQLIIGTILNLILMWFALRLVLQWKGLPED